MSNFSVLSKVILVSSLVLGAIGLITSARASAAVSSAGPLQLSYSSDKIFLENGVAPGNIVNKELTLTNYGKIPHTFSLSTKNVTGPLKDVIYLSPIVDGKEVWKESIDNLAKLPDGSKRVIDSLASNESIALTLRANMADSAGNEFQNQNVTFDIVFGPEELEPVLTATATATVSAEATASTTATGSTASIIARTTRSLARTALAIASETTAAPSPTLSATVTPSGEVKGEQTENGKQMNPWLLLIAPAAAALAILIPLWHMSIGIGFPLVGAAAAALAAYYFHGNMSKEMFWTIFAVETVALVAIDYIWFKRVLAAREARRKNRKK